MIHSKNVWPRGILANYWGPHITAHMFRELLLLAGYTENSNDADPQWTGNAVIVSGGAGFTVALASPRIVTDEDGPGRFTQAMQDNSACINLFGATHDRNRIMARIVRFIDAHNVEIDSSSWNAVLGWFDEIGIAGRVVDPVASAAQLGNGAWSLMDAPAPSNAQLRIVHQTTSLLNVFIRPRGQAADPTESVTTYLFATYNDNWFRFNLIADGPDVVIIQNTGAGYNQRMLFSGLLDNVVSGDNDPAFLTKLEHDISIYYNDNDIDMMNHLGTMVVAKFGIEKTDHNAYMSGLDDEARIASKHGWRLMNGRPGKAWGEVLDVIMTGPSGQYIRGKAPLLRYSYEGWEEIRPIDAAGTLMHWDMGQIIPYNGSGDPLIIRSGHGE